MSRDTLHTVFLAASLLGVHCNGCSHRAILREDELPKLQNNMALLRSLKLRCEKCGLHGAGQGKFTLSIPLDGDEAEAFLQGRSIKSNA
jgi:hypothetical protein